MTPTRLSLLLRGAALALLVGGVGWALVGVSAGWIGGAAFGLTDAQLRAALLPFLVLLMLGVPGIYGALRTGPSWLLLAGTVITEVGLLLLLIATAAAYGMTGQGGDPGAEFWIAAGTVVLGAGAMVIALGLIRQGGTADWIAVLAAALGLTVIPALLEPRFAFVPGLCWAALGFTVWIASAELHPPTGP